MRSQLLFISKNYHQLLSLESVSKGAAAATISGISLSNEKYYMALLLLRERFGRLENLCTHSYNYCQNQAINLWI